jgi:protein TonB
LTQHVTLLDEATLAQDWQPGSRLPRAAYDEERLSARHLMAAVALHILILGAALLLPGIDPPDDEIVTVDLVMEEQGAAGSAGGAETAAAKPAVATAQPAQAPQPKPAVKAVPRPQPQPIAQPKPRPQPAKPPPQSAPTPLATIEPVPPPPLETAPPEPKPAETMPGVTASVGTLVDPRGASPGSGGSGPGGKKGAGHGTSGSGPGVAGEGTGPGDEYFERLRRWLAKHKHYPQDALKQKQQGTVTVAFVLARDGTVLSADIERSSGYPLIDAATLDMMRKASPVPPLPDHFKGERIKIALPIDYKIGFFGRLF